MKVYTVRRIAVLAAAVGASMISLSIIGCGNKQDDASSTPPATTVVTQPAVPPPGTSTTTTTTPAGVSTTTVTPPTNNTNAGPGGATGENASVADAVNKAIHTNTQMTGSRITAVVDSSGVAKLTGTAQNKQQKALAESTARQVSGITHVVDKVEIVATGGTKEANPAPKVIVIHDAPSTPAAPADSSSSTTTGNAADTTTTKSSDTPAPAAGTGQNSGTTGQ